VVGRSNGVIQIFARPTLVAMVTKIGKFCQKIGYNSSLFMGYHQDSCAKRDFRGLSI